MALSIASPTVVQIIKGGLIPVIQADLADVASLIKSVLPSGITLDGTTASDGDASSGALKYLKFGDRGNLPPGLSVSFYPDRIDNEWISAPSEMKTSYAIRVRTYYDDTATNRLTEKPDELWSMMANVTEAISVVLGPTNLGADNTGYWTLPNSLGRLGDPRCFLILPAGGFTMVKRNQTILYGELLWRAWKTYGHP